MSRRGRQRADGTIAFFESASVPLPTFSAIFTIVEIVGGAALILGAFTRVFALLLVAPSLGPVFTAHWGSGFFARDRGYEYVLSLAAFSPVVAAVGVSVAMKMYPLVAKSRYPFLAK